MLKRLTRFAKQVRQVAGIIGKSYTFTIRWDRPGSSGTRQDMLGGWQIELGSMQDRGDNTHGYMVEDATLPRAVWAVIKMAADRSWATDHEQPLDLPHDPRTFAYGPPMGGCEQHGPHPEHHCSICKLNGLLICHKCYYGRGVSPGALLNTGTCLRGHDIGRGNVNFSARDGQFACFTAVEHVEVDLDSAVAAEPGKPSTLS